MALFSFLRVKNASTEQIIVKSVFFQIYLEKRKEPILLSSWENPGGLARAPEGKGRCFRQTGVSKPGVEGTFFHHSPIPRLSSLVHIHTPCIVLAFPLYSNIQNFSTPTRDV